jgi:hypothetical protein
MSRNGSGTYTLPAGNPVVTGTTIASTWANTTLSDIQNALTQSVSADGQTPITGSLQMGNNKIVNLSDPTSAQDAVTKAYADALTGSLGTMSTQNANSVAITGGSITGGFIDGTTIGTTTRADGKFTTLAANGDVSFTSTGFLLIPSGTTAQRPISPNVGEIRYNTNLSQFEGYANSAWGSLGGGATGGGADQIFNLNGQAITVNYTIPSGKNANTTGTITINTGVVVTVSTGSRWVIV